MWYFVFGARVSSVVYSRWGKNAIVVLDLEGAPNAHLVFQPAASSSKPMSWQRDLIAFWAIACDSHISSSEIPGTGFSISTYGYHFPSSEPGWWVLWITEKSLGLRQHLNSPGFQGSSAILGSALFSRTIALGIGKAPQLFLRIPLQFLIIHTDSLELLRMSKQRSQMPSTSWKLHLFSEYWVSINESIHIYCALLNACSTILGALGIAKRV